MSQFDMCITCGSVGMFSCKGVFYCWEHLHGTTKPKMRAQPTKNHKQISSCSHSHPFKPAGMMILKFIAVLLLFGSVIRVGKFVVLQLQ